jgi:hypothetical protein
MGGAYVYARKKGAVAADLDDKAEELITGKKME